MTLRAIELLNIDKPSFILDIGCGSGLSSQVLEEDGHVWVGMDISSDMLNVANERELEGDLFLQDIGQGVGYRPGTFDGCISISVIQWLCNADKHSHNPRKRLHRFFSTLYQAMARGARCVFQFYPENNAQTDMIVAAATKSGFSGGLVIDYPNSTRAKKFFLCLFAGITATQATMPKALMEEDSNNVTYSGERLRKSRSRSSKKIKGKEWVQKKKELNRTRGIETPHDSKYTARKRRVRF